MAKKRKRQPTKMFCNPDICPNCQYIGEGDSYCDEIGEIVLEDWTPTEHFMGRCSQELQGREKKV